MSSIPARLYDPTVDIKWWHDGCRFLEHRNTTPLEFDEQRLDGQFRTVTVRSKFHAVIEGGVIDRLLCRLQEARGTAFMDTAHVHSVLDAKDPAALVERWCGMSDATVAVGRLCARCGERPKAGDGPASRYCAECAQASKRASNREASRKRRKETGAVAASEN